MARTAKRKTSIVTVANQKGGCAKTTVTVNLSSCFASLGKRVLVIDTDPQFNATSYLDCDSHCFSSKGKNIYNALYNELDLKECVVETKWDNLCVLPGSDNLTDLKKELEGTGTEYEIFNELLSSSSYTNEFDIVMFDTHPNFDMFSMASFKASHYYLLPVIPDLFSQLGLDKQIRKIEKFKKYQNNTLHFLGVIMSRMDKKSKLSEVFRKTLLEASENCKGFKITNTEIPDSKAVLGSLNNKTPINHYKHGKLTPAVSAFMALAGELLPELKGKRIGRNPFIDTEKVPSNEDFARSHDNIGINQISAESQLEKELFEQDLSLN